MSRIRFVFLDIDGTLTDGKIYYTSLGEEMKAFNIKDGLAIAAFVRCGFQVVVMTGRKSKIVERRMSELGVIEIFQGIYNKKIFLEEYMQKNNLDANEMAYVGDDLNDLAAMRMCKFKACPADACAEIKNSVDFVSSYKGGNGAIRDIFEFIAKEQGVWEKIVKDYE